MAIDKFAYSRASFVASRVDCNKSSRQRRRQVAISVAEHIRSNLSQVLDVFHRWIRGSVTFVRKQQGLDLCDFRNSGNVWVCVVLFFLSPRNHHSPFNAPPLLLKELRQMHSSSLLHHSQLLFTAPRMEDIQNERHSGLMWMGELKLPELLKSETVRSLHATIDREWDSVYRSACQTAAGRALWNHVIHDPVADVLAGESFLRSLYDKMRKDWLDNAREVSGVILAVRTLWFDSKLEAAINSFALGDGGAQVVLLGAGMDARAYRLAWLKGCSVFEVDFPELLQVKAALLQEAMGSAEQQQKLMTAKSLVRVAADIRNSDWLEKLQRCGFVPRRNTVWVLEGIIYYLHHTEAMQVLRSIAANCTHTHTVLLADFMNKSSVSLSHSTFHFYSDWPDQLLPTLGFSNIKLSQIGDPDAHFGLLPDPQNLFNKLRTVPRSVQTHPEDGTPCRRLYLVEAAGFPNQAT